MSSEVILTIITGVLAIIGGAGFWGYLQSRKEAPISRRAADLAVAEKSQQMSMLVADDLREDYTRLRADLNTERGERIALAGRVDELGNHIREQDKMIREQDTTIRTLRDVLRAFSTGWENLIRDWDTIRLSATPPRKPLMPSQHGGEDV